MAGERLSMPAVDQALAMAEAYGNTAQTVDPALSAFFRCV
jgi:hypothetical protein